MLARASACCSSRSASNASLVQPPRCRKRLKCLNQNQILYVQLCSRRRQGYRSFLLSISLPVPLSLSLSLPSFSLFPSPSHLHLYLKKFIQKFHKRDQLLNVHRNAQASSMCKCIFGILKQVVPGHLAGMRLGSGPVMPSAASWSAFQPGSSVLNNESRLLFQSMSQALVLKLEITGILVEAAQPQNTQISLCFFFF